MSLPETKRFPIEFEMAKEAMPSPTPVATPEHPIVSLAKRKGWNAIEAEGRWVLQVSSETRVLVERSRIAGGGVLRFTKTVRTGPASIAEQTELLRKNAKMAYAGYAMTKTGETLAIVLAATMLEDTADDDEIEAAICAVVSGGEWVVTKPVLDFDHAGYKIAAPVAGAMWEDESLREALEGTGLAYQSTGSHAVVVVRLEGGRKQTVHVFFDRADSTGRQVVQFVSMCGPAGPEQIQAALHSNGRLALATIAMAPAGASEGLVVVRTQLAITADREEILASIMTVGRIADQIESQITGGKDVQ